MSKGFSKKDKKKIRGLSHLGPKKAAAELGLDPGEVKTYMQNAGLMPELSEQGGILGFIDRRALLIVLVMAGVYAAYLSAVSLIRYATYAYDDFDLPIYVQFLDNTLRGRVAYSSIRGGVFFKDHQSFIMFLILPFYAVLRYSWFLLVVQSISIGAAAVPVYFIGKKALSKPWGVLFAFSYLIYAPKTYVNLFEFHPAALGICFLLCTFYFWYSKNFKWFLVFMVLSLLTKEDISLEIFMFALAGVYRAKFQDREKVLTRENLKWILVPGVTSVAYFFVATKLIAPSFREGDYMYVLLFKDWGNTFPEVIKNAATHPFEAIGYMLKGHKAGYLFALLIPVLFLSLLSPVTLLIALPAFAANLLSSWGPTSQMYFQYVSYPTAFIFAAAILGTRRLLGWTEKGGFREVADKLLPLGVAGATIIAAIAYGPIFNVPAMFSGDPSVRHLAPGIGDRVKVYRAMEKQVPEDAKLVTSFRFLNHLAQREEVESSHYVFMQRENITGAPYSLPEHTQWALMDMQDTQSFLGFWPYDAGENFSNTFSVHRPGGWGVVDYADDVVLLKKGATDEKKLFIRSTNMMPAKPLTATFNNQLELFGYDFRLEKKEGVGTLARADLFGRLLPSPNARNPFHYYLVQPLLVDSMGQKIAEYQPRPLGTYFLPTQFWRPGEVVVDKLSVLVPEECEGETCTLLIRVLQLQLGMMRDPDDPAKTLGIGRGGMGPTAPRGLDSSRAASGGYFKIETFRAQ